MIYSQKQLAELKQDNRNEMEQGILAEMLTWVVCVFGVTLSVLIATL